MNNFATPTFVFDAHDPSTSPGFILVLHLPRYMGALKQLRFRSLDFFTGGHALGCLAVLIVGLADHPSLDQIGLLHQISRQWRLAVEAMESVEAAVDFGSQLLGEFHQLFHCPGDEGVYHSRQDALRTALQLTCLRQMYQDAFLEFARRPLAHPFAASDGGDSTCRSTTEGRGIRKRL